jgi:hypothetical protein
MELMVHQVRSVQVDKRVRKVYRESRVRKVYRAYKVQLGEMVHLVQTVLRDLAVVAQSQW